MKTLHIFFIALLCFCYSTAQAQDYITFGPKAGFSVNKFEDIQEQDRIRYSTFSTVSVGLFGRVSPGRLYVQPEVYYVVKGANYNLEDSIRSSGKIRLQTLEAPVLLGYYIIEGTGFNLRALAGPVFNLFTKESQNDLRPWDPERYGIKEGVHSMQFGIGADMLMLSVDARFERGLTRYDNSLGARPSRFTISVGYKLF